ncbi:zinc-dependent metalloprotease [Acidimicrobiia bacterium EGI L10123]|uniref:M12 family metallo-peptidase n=1 Tax=Salinilacustrithrix flava TaxID=2957203 RepID=UPI003D7C24A1|nr:zinc-dependent metalloprotease [Acidimicrobiia bacterium EGI L10123]
MLENRNNPGRARIVAALVAAAVGAATFATGPGSAGAAPPEPPGAPAPVLEERMHGEAAIRALGERLPDVARANGISPDELRRHLRADDELWLDETGALLFIDQGIADHAEPATSAVTDPAWLDHPTSEALRLHSRPGADRVIHLDFDGHDPATSGWGDKTPAQPYDTDQNPSTFSEAERQVIIEVWQRVAEDFAPFAIDVTTEDPGIDAIRRTTSSDQQYGTRVVVTPTATNCNGCGGVAYVGTFDAYGGSDSTGWSHDRYQPAWVYLNGYSAKSIAEAVSHEAGHNLGLRHDGTSTVGYYAGHGDWAPIMGVGYYAPVSQWSRGEYADANNSEDDLTVIATNGGTPATDDHGDTLADATRLAPQVDVAGHIGSRTDVDAFSFTTDGGVLALTASPVSLGANLDLALRLVDDTGTVVADVDPPGLGAQLDATVPAGTYAVIVDGVGAGDPATSGYSDYASLGRYRLTGLLPTGLPEEPEPDVAVPTEPVLTATQADGTVTLGWGADASVKAFEVYRESRHKNGSYRGRTLLGTVGGSGSTWSDSPGSGTFRYQVVATNSSGSAESNLVVVTVTSTGTDEPTDGGGTKGGGNGGGGGKGRTMKAR